uniref:Uncharacterized protein n=1 Tax=Picea glauca TaxID=3330 RepID=A0A101LXK5_PICGL|nr:hypothetical protein ABT39_MTgene6215 [Picea glauca]QHR88738.1 hypothetical protein Q903MT_gene2752 [Picea sitchensis]
MKHRPIRAPVISIHYSGLGFVVCLPLRDPPFRFEIPSSPTLRYVPLVNLNSCKCSKNNRILRVRQVQL